MMQFKSRMIGGQNDLRPVSNSDIIQFDHYLYILRDQVYNKQVQENLLREKRSKAQLRRFEPNQCRICGELTPYQESFFSKPIVDVVPKRDKYVCRQLVVMVMSNTKLRIIGKIRVTARSVVNSKGLAYNALQPLKLKIMKSSSQNTTNFLVFSFSKPRYDATQVDVTNDQS